MNQLICKWIGKENSAAVKAPEDINQVIMRHGGEVNYLWKHNIKYIRNIEEIIMFEKLKRKCNADDCLIVQWPLYEIKPLTIDKLLKIPHRKSVLIIHDIESYRYCSNDEEKILLELNDIKKFDVIIAHNQRMIDFLRQRGVDNQLINLEIFDYLISNKNKDKNLPEQFEICYVGNLNRSKFIDLYAIKCKTKLNLYGPIQSGYKILGSLSYKGIYNPNIEHRELEGHFGLIWEGDSLEECTGDFGNYMKINNALRLSMYLANEIPIIIIKNVAMAEFVNKYKVGILIDSLQEIDSVLSNITEKEYDVLCKNVSAIADDIRNGRFIERALEKAIVLS